MDLKLFLRNFPFI